MKFSSAQPGRVFVLRLEDGEIVHECLERFAADAHADLRDADIMSSAWHR